VDSTPSPDGLACLLCLSRWALTDESSSLDLSALGSWRLKNTTAPKPPKMTPLPSIPEATSSGALHRALLPITGSARRVIFIKSPPRSRIIVLGRHSTTRGHHRKLATANSSDHSPAKASRAYEGENGDKKSIGTNLSTSNQGTPSPYKSQASTLSSSPRSTGATSSTSSLSSILRAFPTPPDQSQGWPLPNGKKLPSPEREAQPEQRQRQSEPFHHPCAAGLDGTCSERAAPVPRSVGSVAHRSRHILAAPQSQLSQGDDKHGVSLPHTSTGVGIVRPKDTERWQPVVPPRKHSLIRGSKGGGSQRSNISTDRQAQSNVTPSPELVKKDDCAKQPIHMDHHILRQHNPVKLQQDCRPVKSRRMDKAAGRQTGQNGRQIEAPGGKQPANLPRRPAPSATDESEMRRFADWEHHETVNTRNQPGRPRQRAMPMGKVNLAAQEIARHDLGPYPTGTARPRQRKTTASPPRPRAHGRRLLSQYSRRPTAEMNSRGICDRDVLRGMHVAVAATCDERLAGMIFEQTGVHVRQFLSALVHFDPVGLGRNTQVLDAGRQGKDLMR